MAMKAEQAAVDFYGSFAGALPTEIDPQVGLTLMYFSTMEIGHYKMLEIERENLEHFEDYDEYWPMMHAGP